MSDFQNLPGTYVSRLDGGLQVVQAETAPLILLLGTADQGIGDEPYKVTDTSKARAMFGGSSQLYQGMTEAMRAYGSNANIYLYRIGTAPSSLTLSGTTGDSVKVVFKNRVATVGTDYRASFDGANGLFYLYTNSGVLVYSNNPNNAVDTGYVDVYGDWALLSGAQSFGATTSGTYGVYVGAQPVGSGNLCSGTAFASGVNGPSVGNYRATYEALEDAYRLLEGFSFDIAVPLGVTANAYNVAYFVSGVGGQEWPDAGMASRDNPLATANPSGTLGWFKSTPPTAQTGKWTYGWADDITTSGSGVLPTHAPSKWVNAAARQSAGYHEVNFGYQLANFCYQHTKNESTCIGVIGMRPPRSYAAVDVNVWAGELPTYDINGNAVVDGFGLAGFPDIAGSSASALNALCTDKATGRTAGWFATDSEYKDDTPLTDANGHPIDIGAYVNVVADSPEHMNAYTNGVLYTNSAASYYAGLIASLDEKIAPTNQNCPGLRVSYKLGKRRLDDLTGVHLVTLAQRSDGVYVVDAPTLATPASDYRRLSTVRIVSLVEKRVRAIGRRYIGQVADDLMKEAFNSDIEEGLHQLVQRGYLKTYRFSVSATKVEEIMGKLNVKLVLVVPMELRQIYFTVSLSVD
jgi:hypothetical protein